MGYDQSRSVTPYPIGIAPSRIGKFHHYFITGAGNVGGQSISVPAACMYGGNTDRNLGHELGHNLGLFHEGNTGTGRMNSKPNYLSMMNYGYSYDYSVGFSRNTIATTLNPTALNETATGLPSSLITKLQGGSWSLLADPANGRVDWNRDGVYDSNVRGAPTWVMTNAPEVAGSWAAPDLDDARGIGMSRLASPSRFYMFTRRTSDQKVQYRYTTSFASCSGGDPIGSCVSWVGPTVIANSTGGAFTAPAVHPVVIGGVEKLMLVYTDSVGTIWYQIGTSADVWSAPKSIETTSVGYEPALAASASGGGLRVYFEKYSVLHRRDYNPSTDTWSSAQWEKTPTNNSIATSFGIAVTSGFESTIAGASFYMALADWSNSNMVQLWRYNSSSDNWSQLTQAWGVTQPTTASAPALAYVPINLSNQVAGQFYVAYKTTDATGEIRIAKTAGNDSTVGATNRQLKWLTPPVPLYNYWGIATGSPELYFKPGVDTNLRGGYTYGNTQKVTFYPIADGAPNVVLKDQNDFVFLKDTLDCSLGAGGCPAL